MPCHDGEGLRWVVAAVLAREPDVSWRGCWMTMSWSGPGRWSVMSWSSCPGWRGATKLGFALLLRFYAVHGRFPTGRGEIPDQAVAHVARLVDVPPDEVAAGGREDTPLISGPAGLHFTTPYWPIRSRPRGFDSRCPVTTYFPFCQ